MRIYLDDERIPKVEPFDIIIRDAAEFEVFLAVCPAKISYISFDHDLGIGKDGYDCAKTLVELDMRYDILSPEFTFNVHSANPVGAANIQAYMNNYLNKPT